MTLLDHLTWPQEPVPFILWRERAGAALREASHVVGDCLSRILGDPEALGALVFSAYLHPGGFKKYTLGSSPDGARLRLHIWPRGAHGAGDAGDPHDHRWDFCSIPLTAPMLEERFAIQPDASENPWIGVRCEERSGDAINARVIAPFALRLEATHIRPVGEVYACPYHAIHRLRPASDAFTATLVLTSRPRVHERPTAFKAFLQENEHCTIRAPRLDIKEATSELSVLIAGLHLNG